MIQPKARALIVILSVMSPAVCVLVILWCFLLTKLTDPVMVSTCSSDRALSPRASPPEAVSRPSEVPPAATNEALQVVDHAA